jgi:phage baseplate assembly protein W
MAFQSLTINPIDLKPRVAVGVSIPFNGPVAFNSTYTTKDQLKSNIFNFFLTNENERIFNNDFGGNFRKNLFEQITSGEIDNIKLSVEDSFTRYFPSVQVREVKVLGNADQNMIQISIKYSVPDTDISDTIQLNFENGGTT